MLTKQPAEVTLSQILEASLNGIITYESVRDEAGQVIDFQFIRLNAVARQMLRLPDDVVGKPMLDQLPGVKEAGLFDQFVQVVETGEPRRFELPFPADDDLFWYDMSVVRLDDGFVVTFNDITRSKRVSLENDRRRMQLDGIVNASLNGIITYEALRDASGVVCDFRATLVNPVAQRALALPDTEPGWLILDRFPGVKDRGLFDQYVQVVDTGEPMRFETPYNEDGIAGWYDVAVVQLGDGFVITFNDITQRKQATLAVEQSAGRLQTVIDTSQTGIMLISPVCDEAGSIVDFRFRVVNRQVASYVGQQPDALIGALASRWFPDYTTNGLLDRYRQTYLTSQPLRFDVHYQSTVSTASVWFDIAATRIDDDVLVTFADFTTLKQLQQQLETSVTELQRSNQNLEQFAYVASHDLQEPLRKIQAFGDIIQAQYAPLIGADGADMIRRMQSAANRMQVLIKDVLAYSRVATRRETVGPVNLDTVLDEAQANLETAIERGQAVIRRSALPTLPGDAPQLRQLFQNLISNALKFMPPGQTPMIDISARPVHGRDAAFTIMPADADRLFYQITVADNGIGFEPHQAEQIFQLFQRLHGRTHYEGTGIGLAIVQKVVENHQGYIRAEGQPGAGATFQVLLPAG